MCPRGRPCQRDSQMHCFPTSSAGATTTTSGSTCSSLRPLLTTWLSLAGLSSGDALSRDLEEAAGVRNWGRLEATSRLAGTGESPAFPFS